MKIFKLKKEHPKTLRTKRISYGELYSQLAVSRGDLLIKPIFIVASVELGNSTTKSILTATDLKTGKTYVLDKAVRMTRDALASDSVFCHTISGIGLSRISIAELVKETLLECTRSAGISVPDLNFVVRSTGVTACFSMIEEVGEVIHALAEGCIAAGIPPKKMISPMTIKDVPEKLQKFSNMDKTYFDGAVTGNIPPAGEEIVANEMEGELVTAGLKGAAKWLNVDYRNPVLSLDFGTTLAGRITDDELPYANVIGSFCGLAGAILDAIVEGAGIVDEKFISVLDIPLTLSRKKGRINKTVLGSYTRDVLRRLDIAKVKRKERVGGVPVNVEAARKNGVTVIGIDAGENGSNLHKIAEIGREMVKEEGKDYLMPFIDEVSASMFVELIRIADEEGLIIPDTKIGLTGRAGITGNKPEIILEKLNKLWGKNMEEEVIFADDALARGAAVLGRCMFQFGTPNNPLGGKQRSGCVLGKRVKHQARNEDSC